MKRLLVYLFIVLGLGLTLNINANAAKTKKIDYLCISQNKDNKKEYVKHKDDEYLLQVFYKNKLLNLQKNKNCAYKVFSTDPIFQPLFDTLSDKNVGKKILADGSWGLTKTIKKKIFLKEYENLKTTKKEPSQTQKVANDEVIYISMNEAYKKNLNVCIPYINNSHWFHEDYYTNGKCKKNEKTYKISNERGYVHSDTGTFLYTAQTNIFIDQKGDQKIQIAEKESNKEQKINKKYIVKITHCQNKDVVTDKFLQYSRASNYVRTKDCKSGYNNHNQRNISHKAALALKYNQQYINRNNKNHFNYCFKPNVGTIFPFNTPPTFCSDNMAIKLDYDGKDYFYYSNKKSDYAYDASSIQKKDAKVAKKESSQTEKVAKKVSSESFCVSTPSIEKFAKFRIMRIDYLTPKCASNFIIDENYKDKLFYAYLLDTMGTGEFQDFNTLKPKSNWKPKKKVKIAKAEPTATPKKKVKVVKKEPKQEEFKPKKTNQDKDPPIIEVAENITVSDSAYEIKGNVKDKSKKIFIEVDGQTIPVKKGKFKLKRFSPVDEQIKIVAIDQWGNRSKPKIVNVTIDIKNIEVAEKIEPLNPTKMKSRKNKDRIALIIGIEKYDQIPSASYANLDAKFFYEYARKGFGISKSNIKLLIDEDADLVKSLGTLNKWLPGKIKSGQTELIIFFAGHGLASNDGKELYILPQDSDPDLLDRTALSRTELFKQIIDLNPESVTMFMDTCYSGISRDEKMLLASARPVRIVANEEEGIPDNFTIFSASQLDQISSGIKEAKHGIFSYYLMKGLEGKADSNNDKKITNGELLAYMDENVSQKAAELGRQQNPSLAGDPDRILMNYR